MHPLVRRPLALFKLLQLPLLIGGLILLVLPALWWFQQQNVNGFEQQIKDLKGQIDSLAVDDRAKDRLQQQLVDVSDRIAALPLTAGTKKPLSQRLTELDGQLNALPTVAQKDKLALQKDLLTLEKDRVNAQNSIYAVLVQALGGTFFFVTAYLTWRNVRATEEKQVTERFSKAVDQLSNSSLEVRLGGIYALERIAKDSEKDHWTIMEILTSFVQSKSSFAHPVTSPLPEGKSRSIKIKPLFAHPVTSRLPASSSSSESMPNPSKNLDDKRQPITMDIQAALTVIGRRDVNKDPSDRQIDLSSTNCCGARLSEASLQGANLRRANLSDTILVGANLSGAYLSEAYLYEASLSSANLHGAALDDTHLNGAQLIGADLREANLNGAMLCDAQLIRANLRGADFDGAMLRNAYLTGANLRQASLNGADLSGAFLIRADLEGANVNSANFSGTKLSGSRLDRAIALTQEQLNAAFVDQQTTVPSHLTRPQDKRAESSP